MSAETVEVPIHRWSCQKGHFLAESSVQSEDFRDDGAYYGVSSRIWATCKACGNVDDPQLVQIGTQQVSLA